MNEQLISVPISTTTIRGGKPPNFSIVDKISKYMFFASGYLVAPKKDATGTKEKQSLPFTDNIDWHSATRGMQVKLSLVADHANLIAVL